MFRRSRPGLILLAGAALLLAGCGHATRRTAASRPPLTTHPTPVRAPSVVTTAPPAPPPPPPAPATVPAPLTAAGCAAPVAAWPLQDRVEQLLMVGGQFADLPASSGAAAAGVGGLVLFGQPAAAAAPSIRAGLADLKAAAGNARQVAPWMATDEEGGDVARLAGVIGSLPSPRQMAAQWTTAQVRAEAASHGSSMGSLGITMDLAPLFDSAGAGDAVADEDRRAFSADPKVAGAYGAAFARGLLSAGVVPVAKHFPGLGHASANTDQGPATDPPLAQLQSDDLVAFQQAVAQNVPVIMVGHPAVPGLTGGLPASLSPATYAYLRHDVGFGGVAMTDDLNALAIAAAGYSQPGAAVAALEAGADMAMVDSSEWQATEAAVSQVAGTPALPLEQLDSSVGRILAAKGVATCPGQPSIHVASAIPPTPTSAAGGY